MLLLIMQLHEEKMLKGCVHMTGCVARLAEQNRQNRYYVKEHDRHIDDVAL